MRQNTKSRKFFDLFLADPERTPNGGNQVVPKMTKSLGQAPSASRGAPKNFRTFFGRTVSACSCMIVNLLKISILLRKDTKQLAER